LRCKYFVKVPDAFELEHHFSVHDEIRLVESDHDLTIFDDELWLSQKRKAAGMHFQGGSRLIGMFREARTKRLVDAY
jgi:hypothetical protein